MSRNLILIVKSARIKLKLKRAYIGKVRSRSRCAIREQELVVKHYDQFLLLPKLQYMYMGDGMKCVGY